MSNKLDTLLSPAVTKLSNPHSKKNKSIVLSMVAVSIFAVVKELNTALLGGRIEKVFQGEKYQITMALRANKNNYRLLI